MKSVVSKSPSRLLYLLICSAMLVALAAGCGDDSTGSAGDELDEEVDAGADSGNDDAGDTGDQSAPTVSDLLITQNPNSVLSALVEFETDEPALATVTVAEADGSHSFTIEGPTETATSHRIGVVGMHPKTDYLITVSVADAAQNAADTEPQAYTTGSLPGDFPPIEVTTSSPDRTQDGITVMSVSRFENSGIDRDWGYLVGVDEAGAVVWYHQTQGHPYGAIVLSNGNLAYISGHHAIVEIDWMGEVVTEWTTEELGVDTVHHELFEMPNGHLVTLSSEAREISGYPDGDGGTTSYHVVGDVVVEFKRDGTVVGKWSMFDLLDPMRTDAGFDAGFWNYDYGQLPATKDWTHSNGVYYDPSDDSFVVSVRHQDWLVKFSRESGELIWRLGEEGDFTMKGDGQWQYHQHAPTLLSDGSILLYDNGNDRPGVAPADRYSRAVRFSVDADAMEVAQVWEYRGETSFYSPYVSEADMLANGNLLIADGGRVADPAAPLVEATNLKWGRVLEISGDDPAEVLFELVVRDESTSDPTHYFIYRAEKTRSFPAF